MVPATLTVATGTTVKFQMTKGTYEAHTATFGPGNTETEPASYLGAIAAPSRPPSIDPRGAYPSDVDAGVAEPDDCTATASGTRACSTSSRRPPLPESASVKFDTARHLHVLLPDPPLHARYRHRPVRRLTAC